MIGYLEGIVLVHTETGIILQVGSIGYDLLGISLTNHPIGSSLSLFTHLSVGGDNQPTLIGFSSLESRSLFRSLLKVSGVGPKTALAVIESGSLDSVKTAIMGGDINFLTHVKGLSKKTAQKIILELKQQLVESPPPPHFSSLYSALLSLKFSRVEIDQALSEHDLTDLTEEEGLRLILQSLGK